MVPSSSCAGPSLLLITLICCGVHSLHLYEFQAMLKDRHYQMRENPLSTSNQPVNVTVQMLMSNIGPIDSQKLTFQVSTHLNLWWNDHRLRFPNSSRPVTLVGNPKGFIWIPDMAFLNMHTTQIRDSFLRHVMTVINEKGDVYLSAQMTVVAPCPMDLRLYPMDSQRCDLLIGSYGYSNKDIRPRWHKKPIVGPLFNGTSKAGSTNAKLAGYTLESFSISNGEKSQQSGPDEFSTYLYLKAMFRVKRTLSYYIVRSYLPSTLLVTCSWATFFLPPTTYPARVGLIVTNFLASTFVYQKSSVGIAEVSYVTAMEVYMMLNIFFILFVMVEYVIVLQLPADCIRTTPSQFVRRCLPKLFRCNSTPTKKTVPIEMEPTNGSAKSDGELKHLMDSNGNAANHIAPDITISQSNATAPEKEKKPSVSKVHAIDRLARLIMPLVYVVSLVVYFSYYAHGYFYDHLKH